MAYPHEVQILGEGRSRRRLKDTAEVAGVEALVRADLFEGDVLAVMRVDVGEGGVYLLHLF